MRIFRRRDWERTLTDWNVVLLTIPHQETSSAQLLTRNEFVCSADATLFLLWIKIKRKKCVRFRFLVSLVLAEPSWSCKRSAEVRHATRLSHPRRIEQKKESKEKQWLGEEGGEGCVCMWTRICLAEMGRLFGPFARTCSDSFLSKGKREKNETKGEQTKM